MIKDEQSKNKADGRVCKKSVRKKDSQARQKKDNKSRQSSTQ